MLKRTAAALKVYDQLLAKDVSDTILEEQRKAVAIAFSKESPNSEERCLELIYPGPPIPGPGRGLSFVRQMVEMSKTSDMRWNDRLVQYARVRGYKDPAKLLDDDQNAMLEFRFWIQRKWQEWYTHIGVGALSIEKQRFYQDHEKFDLWLSRERS